MGTYESIHNAPFDQLLRWWEGIDPSPEDFETEYIDEVAFPLSRAGPHGVAVLKRFLYSKDIPRRKAAVYFLADPQIADQEVRQALIDAFQEPDLSLKTAALHGLMRLEYFPLARAEVEALAGHADQRIAALAMRYLSRAFPDETITILRQALRSDNPRMREYACDEIGDRGIDELITEMHRLVGDPDQYVAEAARSNMEFFLGDSNCP